MRKTLLFMLFLSMTVSMLAAPDVVSADGIGRIPTVTRLVKLFLDLEGHLIQAVGKRDMHAVSSLLSDDFEMRLDAMPGNPIPRDEWLRKSFGEPKSSSTIEQMAVHDLGKTAIVSYLWKIKATNSESESNIFVIDIWKHVGKDWKLAIRYAAPSQMDDAVIPGAALSTPTFEKKE